VVFTHFPDQEITVNANLTRTIAIARSAELQRAARDALTGRLDGEPEHRSRRAHRLTRLLHVRRSRASGRLATSPESCDA
jgi:hypothetical protein